VLRHPAGFARMAAVQDKRYLAIYGCVNRINNS
jgi:hypothetical protein